MLYYMYINFINSFIWNYQLSRGEDILLCGGILLTVILDAILIVNTILVIGNILTMKFAHKRIFNYIDDKKKQLKKYLKEEFKDF